MTITWIESRGDCSTGMSSVMRGLSSLIVATMRAMPHISVELGMRNEELLFVFFLLNNRVMNGIREAMRARNCMVSKPLDRGKWPAI